MTASGLNFVFNGSSCARGRRVAARVVRGREQRLPTPGMIITRAPVETHPVAARTLVDESRPNPNAGGQGAPCRARRRVGRRDDRWLLVIEPGQRPHPDLSQVQGGIVGLRETDQALTEQGPDQARSATTSSKAQSGQNGSMSTLVWAGHESRTDFVGDWLDEVSRGFASAASITGVIDNRERGHRRRESGGQRELASGQSFRCGGRKVVTRVSALLLHHKMHAAPTTTYLPSPAVGHAPRRQPSPSTGVRAWYPATCAARLPARRAVALKLAGRRCGGMIGWRVPSANRDRSGQGAVDRHRRSGQCRAGLVQLDLVRRRGVVRRT